MLALCESTLSLGVTPEGVSLWGMLHGAMACELQLLSSNTSGLAFACIMIVQYQYIPW